LQEPVSFHKLNIFPQRLFSAALSLHHHKDRISLLLTPFRFSASTKERPSEDTKTSCCFEELTFANKIKDKKGWLKSLN
jgi:hypothetical protein